MTSGRVQSLIIARSIPYCSALSNELYAKVRAPARLFKLRLTQTLLASNEGSQKK